MDTSILEDIGLTGAEIKVFTALLEIGSSTAGKVVEKSKLHNAVVHRAFHSLAEKGLVTHILQGKTKHYKAIEPKLLLNFLDEKKEKLKKIIPELEAKQKQQEQKPQATMFEGIRGVKELLTKMSSHKDEEYIAYGGPQEAHEVLGDFFWDALHRRRIKNNTKARLIFNKSLSWWAKELNKRKITKVRLSDEQFEECTETIICKDSVAIILYLEKPFGFLIESKMAAKSHKNFFEILWENANN